MFDIISTLFLRMCHPKVSEYKDLQIRKQTFRLRITDSHTLNIRMTHPNEL